MKRIFDRYKTGFAKKAGFFLMTFCVMQSLFAQSNEESSIELNLSLKTSRHHMECDTHVDVTITFSDNTTRKETFTITGEVNDGNTYTFSARTINAAKLIKTVRCDGVHRDDPTGPGGCMTRGSGSNSASITTSNPCVTGSITKFLGAFDDGCILHYKISNINKRLEYSANGISITNGAFMLPDTKKIRLTAPGGYISSVYSWKYKTSDASAWDDLPPSYQGKDIIEFTGNDLFGDFRELVVNGKNVQIRLDYVCGQSSIITLTPLLVAPEISEAAGINTTCGRDDNGQIKIKYSRPLYEGEYLNFQVNSQESSDPYAFLYGWNDPDIVKNLENREISIKNLNIGNYKVRLLSYLNDDTHVLYTDESGDFSRQNIAITFGGEPVEIVTPVETTDISCKGDENGTLSLSATGGSGTYHIELHKETENAIFKQSASFTTGEKGTITGLPAGSYDAYIVDDGGCISDFVPVDIYEPDDYFTIETVNTVEATFNENYEEEENGSIRISVSDDYGPFTYVWKEENENGNILSSSEDTDSNIATLENINSGSYYVNITNANGCSVDTLIVVQRSPNVSFSIQQTGDIICSGDNTGQLTATASGGVPPYTYQWYRINEYTGEKTATGGNDLILSGIAAGPYQLWITDAKGSRAQSQIFTQTEKNPIIVSFQTEKLDCKDDSDGFLEVSISGGTPPYSYTWYNGSVNSRIEGLKAGIYSIHVADAAGCFKNVSGIVEGPAPLHVEAEITNPSCYDMNNGSIKLTVSGGNTPYTYNWSTNSEQAEITNLGRGTYSVTVTDGKDCEVIQKTFVIDRPEKLVAELHNYKPVSRHDANDGSFSVLVKGGTSAYSIRCIRDGLENISASSVQEQNDGSYLFSYTNLRPENYEITVTDRNYNSNPSYQGCSSGISVNLPNPPPLSANISEIQSIACFDGDGVLEAAGTGGDTPYTYEWFSVANNNRTPLPVYTAAITVKSGTYIARITDNSGFSVFSSEYSIGQPEILRLNLSVQDNACYGRSDGQILANVQGGVAPYQYAWDSGETTALISGKQNGKYSVTVTDQNGCQISGEASVNSPGSFRIEYELTPVSCFGLDDASIKLKVSGGTAPYTYTWSGDSHDSILKNIGSGTYKVSIEDSNNCSFDTTFVIPDLIPIQAKLLNTKTPVGYGYSDGVFTVEISGGNPPYNVYWTNEQGVEMDSASIENGNDKAIALLKGVSEGNYYLHIEDANYQRVKDSGLDPCGCTDTLVFYMPQPPKLEVNIHEIKSITCFGLADGAIASGVTGGVPFETGLPYAYEWILNDAVYQNNTTEINGLTAGTYRLKVTDANGIEALSESCVLGQPDALTLQFQTADIKCSLDTNGWAEVTVSGGAPPYSYEWSTGDTSPRIENIPKGKYFCWVKDANQCEVTGIVQVVQANAIKLESELIEPTCRGGADGKIMIKLSGGEPPYTYEWENGEKTLIRTGLSKGSYTFTVSDVHGCGYETTTYDLGEPEEITVDLGEDRELCFGQELSVKAKIPEPAQSFTWYDSNGKELFVGEEYTLSQAGTYTVKAITAKGCTAYGSITITRDDRKIASDFLVASKVPVNDDVYAINVSLPEPEKVEWILPEEGNFEVIEENNQLLAVIFHEYGEYTIGMKAFSGKCWETTCKSIRVMDKIDIDNYEDADEPMLRSFSVRPNPASERFTAVIELKEKAPVELFLINSGTGIVVQRKHLQGSAVYTEIFDLPPTQKGNYVLKMIAPKANAVLKVISK